MYFAENAEAEVMSGRRCVRSAGGYHANWTSVPRKTFSTRELEIDAIIVVTGTTPFSVHNQSTKGCRCCVSQN